MKSKKPNLASTSTPETKTAKIHNAYLQNSQCQTLTIDLPLAQSQIPISFKIEQIT
jgi:hypothetical protein